MARLVNYYFYVVVLLLKNQKQTNTALHERHAVGKHGLSKQLHHVSASWISYKVCMQAAGLRGLFKLTLLQFPFQFKQDGTDLDKIVKWGQEYPYAFPLKFGPSVCYLNIHHPDYVKTVLASTGVCERLCLSLLIHVYISVTHLVLYKMSLDFIFTEVNVTLYSICFVT